MTKKINVSEFSRGLIAALRTNGIVTFRCIILEGLINAGLEAAIEKLRESGIILDEPFINDDKFMNKVLDYGLMKRGPRYYESHDTISLPSKEAAEDYFKHSLPNYDLRVFKEAAKVFMSAFRKRYVEAGSPL